MGDVVYVMLLFFVQGVNFVCYVMFFIELIKKRYNYE